MPIDPLKRAAFQNRAIDAGLEALEAGYNFKLSAPTGSGKTRMFLAIAEAQHKRCRPGHKTLVLADRVTLVLQNSDVAEENNVLKCSRCVNGHMDQSGDIVFATPDTFSAYLKNAAYYHLVIVDEAHHAREAPEGLAPKAKAPDPTFASEYARILDHLSSTPNPPLFVGVSATLDRDDRTPLHPVFQESPQQRVVTHQITLQEAVAAGVILTPTRTIQPKLPGTDAVSDIYADHFDPRTPARSITGLQAPIEANRPPDFYNRIAEIYDDRYPAHPPTLAYCDTIAQSKQLLDALNEAGIPAALYCSQMSEKKSAAALSAYTRGNINVLISADRLTEGLDVPKTSLILCSKATTTRNEWIQINGRAMRADPKNPDKVSYDVLDFGASTLLHGDMNQIRRVEAYVNDKTPLPSEKLFSPWTVLARSTDGRTSVFGTHDGQKFQFLVHRPDIPAYLRVEADFLLTGHKSRRGIHFSLAKDPPRAIKSINGIHAYGRNLTSNSPSHYASLATKPAEQGLSAIVRNVWANHRDSILGPAQPPLHSRLETSISR